jgi:hypothetical protein
LIIAANLRQSQELAAANMLPEDIDARDTYSDDDVKAAAELEDGQLVPNSATKRGRYLVYLFAMPDGRIGKDALLINDKGDLELPDRPDTPERASLRASVKAARKVDDAKQKAEEIIAKAREEAQRIIQEAAAKAEEQRRDDHAKNVKKAQEQDDPGPAHADLSTSGGRQGKPGLRVKAEADTREPRGKRA